MWRIFGLIFFNDKDKFFNASEKTVDKSGIQRMLTDLKIGVGETVTQAIRTKDNASDKFLEIVSKVDLPKLLAEIPECNDFVTTGEKAASVIAGITGTPVPKVGENIVCEITMADGSLRRFHHWRMPSTSRAYPMKLEEKAEFYRRMFRSVGILS